MKLKKKSRISSKLKRSYFPAQTPFQRLKQTDQAKNKTIKKLDGIYHALDPVRLLKQIESLQNALWQHVVSTKQLQPSKVVDNRDQYSLKFQGAACGLCADVPAETNDNFLIVDPGIRKKRHYRKSKKPRVKHWWRTRKDPFAGVWEEVCKWLENNPERTATSILLELQKKYPEDYSKRQLRTLQRRVQAWRKNAIITFDDKWLKEDLEIKNLELGKLKAVVIDESIEKEELVITM